MPRRKVEVTDPTPVAIPAPTVDSLVAEWNQIKAHLTSENKKFGEYMKPYKDRQEVIENQLHEFLLKTGQNSAKTDHGTAYLSTLTQPKIEDREKYLDWALENWDVGGGAMLQIGAPQVTAFEEYVEKQKKAIADGMTNLDITPPGTTVSYFQRVNIRKS